MKKLTILVDVDNVLEELTLAWVERLNEKYGTAVKLDDITEWDMTKFFPTLERDEVFSPLHEVELWESMKPMSGSIEYVKRLIADGHDVVIVTASHIDTIPMKYKLFLKKYFSFIPYSNVIFTNRKQLIAGDVLVDDAPHNLIGGKYKCILFDSSHNRSFDAEAHGFIRAKGWKHVYSIVSSIAEENT